MEDLLKTELKRQHERMTAPFTDIMKQYDVLWRKNIQLEQENQAFEKALVIARHENSMKMENAVSKEELQKLEMKIKLLEEKNKLPATSSTSQQQRIEDLETSITRLNSSLKERDELIAILQEELSQTKKLFTQLSSENSS